MLNLSVYHYDLCIACICKIICNPQNLFQNEVVCTCALNKLLEEDKIPIKNNQRRMLEGQNGVMKISMFVDKKKMNNMLSSAGQVEYHK